MNELIQHYIKVYKKYGPTPKGVSWSSTNKTIIRYRFISDFINNITQKKKISVLDVGCGYGALLKYINHRSKNFKYLGIDSNSNSINFAKDKYKLKNISFEKISLLNLEKKKKYNIVLANGLFTFKHNLTEKKMYNFLFQGIKKMINLSNEYIIFNIMSRNVDYIEKNIFYPKLIKVLNFIDRFKKSYIIDTSIKEHEIFIIIKKKKNFYNIK
ncbi:class I SAM-dependent methyltransferase [Candidatus Pelagibacter sp.]|nr:class I SAM-dependent methyltransferase [Candidatus Pelagibacter sp.]